MYERTIPSRTSGLLWSIAEFDLKKLRAFLCLPASSYASASLRSVADRLESWLMALVNDSMALLLSDRAEWTSPSMW
jgi:hypothetical protein